MDHWFGLVCFILFFFKFLLFLFFFFSLKGTYTWMIRVSNGETSTDSDVGQYGSFCLFTRYIIICLIFIVCLFIYFFLFFYYEFL